MIGLVGFVVRKVCDNSRAGSCDEKVKGVTIVMSWKVDVLIRNSKEIRRLYTTQ